MYLVQVDPQLFQGQVGLISPGDFLQFMVQPHWADFREEGFITHQLLLARLSIPSWEGIREA